MAILLRLRFLPSLFLMAALPDASGMTWAQQQAEIVEPVQEPVVVNPELGGLRELEKRPPPGSAAAQERDNLWRDRLYRDQLIQAWIKNPALYEATKRVLEDPARGSIEYNFLQSRENSREMLKDMAERVPGPGGVVVEDWVRGLEGVSQRKDERVREEMLDSMGEIQGLAETVRKHAYEAEQGANTPIHEALRKISSPDLGDLPRPVGTLEAMKAQAPDAAAAADEAVSTMKQSGA